MVARLGGQTAWGWKVAAYLFLAGVGAGAYLDAQVLDWLNEGVPLASRIGTAIGGPLVAFATLFLVWDLGMPRRFWRAGMVPVRSWIARGVIILGVFILLSIVHIATMLWPWTGLQTADTARLVLGVIGAAFALLTLTYTGLLLGAVRPIPFWTMPTLPLLFIVSGMSTGVMAVHLVLPVYTSATGVALGDQAAQLASYDAGLIVVEMLVLLIYLLGAHATTASRHSALLMLTGSQASAFWGGLVLAGLVVPLVAALMEATATGATEGSSLALAVIGAVPGLAGGFILRYLVIGAGVKAPLSVSSVLMPQRL